MTYLYNFLSQIMNSCYSWLGNYGYAIILFTFISRIVLLPVSLWTYFNSITMIKIQPDINFLKVKYYGMKDVLDDEQARLFKQANYHPLISIVPVIIQLVLLIGVVGVIREGIHNPAINMKFGSIYLGAVPSQEGIRLIWSPIAAGFSAWILCIAQNASNVLQSEQSLGNKWGTMAFSVGLSLYLGWFVPVGTAFYWIWSNLFAVLQLYITNWIVCPRKYVDYEKLEKSREELRKLDDIKKTSRKKYSFFSETRKRERRDYKRFFHVVNKHIVFYSESNGFYKYFKGFIEYLLDHTNVTIHYITSDPDDHIFEMEKQNKQIRAYYISENKLIVLMMRLEADVVVMTMPDLENFHIKRSYFKKDIEYVFVQHGMGSNNMGMRKGCTDHFDTVFCSGIHQKEEEAQKEAVYNLPRRNLVEVGYPPIDEMRKNYVEKINHPKKILIAPSWQKDNIIDSCLEKILDGLKDKNYEIIVRPHPQEVRLKKDYMNYLKEKYNSNTIEIQTDFSSNNPIMEADLLISDWSGITWEYAFTTKRPILFINTPMKVENPEYTKIDVVPLNVLLRDKLGKSLNLNELNKVSDTVDYLIDHSNEYKDKIEELAQTYIYNLGKSAEVGARYLIKTMKAKAEQRKKIPV